MHAMVVAAAALSSYHSSRVGKIVTATVNYVDAADEMHLNLKCVCTTPYGFGFFLNQKSLDPI